MTTFMSISDIRRKKQFTLNNYWECDTLLTILSLILRRESESKVVKSCLTLCDPMDCSLPGSSVHGIFQARVLEWGAIAFSRAPA